MSAISSITLSSTTSGSAQPNDDTWQDVVPEMTAETPKAAAHDPDYPMRPVDSELRVKRTAAPAPAIVIPPAPKPPCSCPTYTGFPAGPYPYVTPISSPISPPTPKPTATLFCQEQNGKSAVAKIFLPRTYEETKAAALRAFPDILNPSSDAEPKEFDVKVRIRAQTPQSGPSYGYRGTNGFIWASVHTDDWWEMLSDMMKKDPMDPVELQVEVKGRCEGRCASGRMQGQWGQYPAYGAPYPMM